MKKNKYMEFFDTVVAESKYSVADPVHNALDIVDRVLTLIASDLEMTKYKTDINIRHPLGRFLSRYISVAKRTCIDIFVSGLPRNNIFFSGIQVDSNELKISVIIRRIADDTFVDPTNIFNIFDTDSANVVTKLFSVAVKIDTTTATSRSNIKVLREFVDALIKYLELDETVVLTLKDYNHLLKLITHLENEVNALKKQFNEGTVKIKRDKKINDNINNALNNATVVGFTNAKATSIEIQAEMIGAGWVAVEIKMDSDTQIRMTYLDAKVHPTMVYISITDKDVKFYLAKFVTPVDEVTGHQKVEYDLLHVSTNLTDAKTFIRTNLCQ